MPDIRNSEAIMPPDTATAPRPASPRRIASIADLERWVAEAQPNARLSYGFGAAAVAAACPPLLARRAAELAERGWLTTHFIRGRGGAPDRHIVQRTQRPFLKGSRL